MRGLARVAWFEYRRHVSSLRFLVVTLGVPLLMLVVATVVVVAARTGAESQGADWGVVGGEALWPDAVEFEDVEAATAALASDEIAGYVSLQPEGRSEVVGAFQPPELIAQALEERAMQATLAEAPSEVRDLLLQPAEIRYFSLEASGARPAEGAGLGLAMLLALIIPLVFVVAVMFATNFLILAVTEEKVNRLVEILMTSVSARDLLGGKVVGLGALSLTQSVVWLLAIAVAAALLFDIPETAIRDALSWQGVALSVLFFVFGYLLYAALMTGIGVALGQPREAQQMAGLLSLVMLLPFLFVALILVDPDGAIARLLSLIPLTSPVVMPMRLVLSAVAATEAAVSLVALVLSVWLMIIAAGRVFRASMLLYGQRLTVGAVVAALRA